jgi:hypothetical protein
MPDAAGGFENTPAVEAESLGGSIHRADDRGRSVVGIERRGSSVLKFFLGEIRLKGGTLLSPFPVVIVEDLGHRAPTDVFDQHRLFLGGRWPFLRIKRAEGFDGFEILLKLLLWPAIPKPIGFRDSIAAEIPRWFFLMAARYSSGGSRMYFSRTISQAWSWACCAVDPCCINWVRIVTISSFVFASASRSI